MFDLALLDSGYNQKTGRYGFSWAAVAGGDVLFDETQAYAVMTAVACQRRGYWVDRTFGGDLSAVRNIGRGTPSQVESAALDAMTALEAANLIKSPTARAYAIASNLGIQNAMAVDVSWTTPGGQPVTRRIGG